MIEKLANRYHVHSMDILLQDKLNEVIEAVNKQEALVTARWEIINGSVTMYDQATGDKIAEASFRDNPTDTEMLDWMERYEGEFEARSGDEYGLGYVDKCGDAMYEYGNSLRDCIRKAMEEDNENNPD